MPNQITCQRLRELLEYNATTGTFTRKATAGNRSLGATAGYLTRRGYVRVGVGSRYYAAHRLAWLWAYGRWPKAGIDHIDGNKSNNLIVNLREATQGENCQNLQRAHGNSKSGVLGVCWNKRLRKWVAQIKVSGTVKHIGCFDSIGDASTAYRSAKSELHPFSPQSGDGKTQRELKNERI